MNHPNTSAVILAAGNGSRFGGTVTKQQIRIDGVSVLERTVKAFAASELVSSLVIVCRAGEEEFAREAGRVTKKNVTVTVGGNTRQDSAAIGVDATEKDTEFVAVADAARCLIHTEDINKVIYTAYETGAASAVRAVTDTVKRTDGEGRLLSTFDRNELRLAETPQVFRKSEYQTAAKKAKEDGFCVTDDNALMEHAGIPVTGVELSSPNLKITAPADAAMAEFLLKGRAMGEQRIGHGYDVHRLTEGRKLILGGVEIPNAVGLLGHSDADVLVHAIMDALLGAIGEGDIGRHFPDNDDKYLGISSLSLLKEVGEILKEHGATVVNIDATVVMQKPKMAPYIKNMVENIAKTLSIQSSRVNVKATTEERLGFTGAGEGVAAHAVASVVLF